MKSKLTLRLDAQVKEQAKKIARKKGTSVSKLVEEYFQLLVDEDKSNREEDTSANTDDKTSAPPLPPRIQELKKTLGQPAPTVQMDEDTRAWIEAAAEKHA